MVSGKVKVITKNGIHLRLASELVKAANSFRSEIMIAKDSQEVNAKSILGVAGLGAEVGSELFIKAEGDDEKEALEYLIGLVESDFQKEKER
ncbi:MAG TPA: HPr family phosphocarrier protein [Candidatus Eisenbacteria bacterium]|uniref:HPr family phosphocarrier protein n=1 Tax=Eiseniibacteriota bacterium TaxID=2212470 RepID=A0A7V2AVA5_UNCEI|nr:HPr family phosphocarrier protein [Candidatus Eisenbacteria bacterium]